MQHIYPAIKAFAEAKIVINQCELYVEQSGNPNGIPVLVLHYGPGSIATSFYRRLFNPDLYRIIMLDYRGLGQSQPMNDLTTHNTQQLVADLVELKHHLKLDKWVVFGCGYGATLGLLYAQSKPQDILAMLLVGTQLCRSQDLHWFYQKGANFVFPDYWQDYIVHLTPKCYGDTIYAYHYLLKNSDDIMKMTLAKSWYNWHYYCMHFKSSKPLELNHNKYNLYDMALIQSYYLANKFFMQENQLLDNISLIADIPAYLLHGRYDMVASLSTSHNLQLKWHNSQLRIIREAGHAVEEMAMYDAITNVSDTLAKEIACEFVID